MYCRGNHLGLSFPGFDLFARPILWSSYRTLFASFFVMVSTPSALRDRDIPRDDSPVNPSSFARRRRWPRTECWSGARTTTASSTAPRAPRPVPDDDDDDNGGIARGACGELGRSCSACSSGPAGPSKLYSMERWKLVSLSSSASRPACWSCRSRSSTLRLSLSFSLVRNFLSRSSPSNCRTTPRLSVGAQTACVPLQKTPKTPTFPCIDSFSSLSSRI